MVVNDVIKYLCLARNPRPKRILEKYLAVSTFNIPDWIQDNESFVTQENITDLRTLSTANVMSKSWNKDCEIVPSQAQLGKFVSENVLAKVELMLVNSRRRFHGKLLCLWGTYLSIGRSEIFE